MFSAPTKYRVVKITHSSSEVVLRTTKHTVIYPDLGLSLEVIAVRPVVSGLLGVDMAGARHGP
jgi:hypothetical protein